MKPSPLVIDIVGGFTDFVLGFVENAFDEIGDALATIPETLIKVAILPPQPQSSARHIDGEYAHNGNTPSDGTCNGTNNGAWSDLWEAMYCLNDELTYVALALFGLFITIWLLQIGLGVISLGEIAESFWMLVLTFVFIVANEEILGLGWAGVYLLSEAIMDINIGGSSGVDSAASAIGGGLSVGAIGAAIATFANPGFATVILALFIIIFVLYMTFLLIMAFIGIIAMVGYGIFPILALMVGIGEVSGRLKGKTKKISGFFIPAMWCPLIFSMVFLIASTFTNLHGFADDLSGQLAGALFGPLLSLGFLILGTWIGLQQFKAGQFAVKAGVGTAMAIATGGTAALTGGSLSSALKGYSMGGGKGALANTAADGMKDGNDGGLANSFLGSDDEDDDLSEEEGFVDGDDDEDEEDEEIDDDLDEITDADEEIDQEELAADDLETDAEEEEEDKSLREKAKDKALAFNKNPGKFLGKGVKKGGDGLQNKLMEGYEDVAENNPLDFSGEDEGSVIGSGKGKSTHQEKGLERFENGKEQTMEQIENGDLDAEEGVEQIAGEYADVMGLEGEDKEEFIESEVDKSNSHIDDVSEPGMSDQRAASKGFGNYIDGNPDDVKAMVGNSKMLHGKDFSPDFSFGDSKLSNTVASEGARKALAQDPTLGMTDGDLSNFDEDTVMIGNAKHGGEAASDMQMRMMPESDVKAEHGMAEKVARFEDVGNGMIEAEIDNEQLKSNHNYSGMDRVEEVGDGVYRMDAKTANNVGNSIIKDEAVADKGHVGIEANKGAAALMEQNVREQTHGTELKRALSMKHGDRTAGLSKVKEPEDIGAEYVEIKSAGDPTSPTLNATASTGEMGESSADIHAERDDGKLSLSGKNKDQVSELLRRKTELSAEQVRMAGEDGGNEELILDTNKLGKHDEIDIVQDIADSTGGDFSIRTDRSMSKSMDRRGILEHSTTQSRTRERGDIIGYRIGTLSEPDPSVVIDGPSAVNPENEPDVTEFNRSSTGTKTRVKENGPTHVVSPNPHPQDDEGQINEGAPVGPDMSERMDASRIAKAMQEKRREIKRKMEMNRGNTREHYNVTENEVTERLRETMEDEFGSADPNVIAENSSVEDVVSDVNRRRGSSQSRYITVSGQIKDSPDPDVGGTAPTPHNEPLGHDSLESETVKRVKQEIIEEIDVKDVKESRIELFRDNADVIAENANAEERIVEKALDDVKDMLF